MEAQPCTIEHITTSSNQQLHCCSKIREQKSHEILLQESSFHGLVRDCIIPAAGCHRTSTPLRRRLQPAHPHIPMHTPTLPPTSTCPTHLTYTTMRKQWMLRPILSMQASQWGILLLQFAPTVVWYGLDLLWESGGRSLAGLTGRQQDFRNMYNKLTLKNVSKCALSNHSGRVFDKDDGNTLPYYGSWTSWSPQLLVYNKLFHCDRNTALSDAAYKTNIDAVWGNSVALYVNLFLKF